MKSLAIQAEGRIQQLKLDVEDKLRTLTRQKNIDNDEIRKEMEKRINDLIAN